MSFGAARPVVQRARRVVLPWLLRAAVSAIVLTFLFTIVPIEQVWNDARRLPPLLWLFALGVFLLGHCAAAAKWRSHEPAESSLQDTRLLHCREGGVESQLRALLCGHLRWDSAKRLRAHAVRIPDPLERLEEADQIDAALSRHEALVVTDVLGWRRLRIGNVDVVDAIATVDRNHNDKPNEAVVMYRVYIEEPAA